MPNEVDVVISGTDKTSPAATSAKKNMKGVGDQAEQTGKQFEKADKQAVGAKGALEGLNSGVERGQAAWAKGTVAVAAGVGAFQAANKVLNDGIAIQLASANAQVALGENYGMLKQAAETQAHSLGLTTSEYEKAAGMTASLAKNMGFTQEVATQFGMMMPDLSNKLSLLSGGLTSAGEAGDMMRAAMAGEFDPLQTLGINISAATVATEALAIQQKNGQKFTEQQANALAVLSIVQGQTADSTKVLATEAGKAAKEAAENSAEMRQAWQDLERESVPVLSKLTQNLGDVMHAAMDIGAVFKNPTDMDSWSKSLKGLGDTLNPVQPIMNLLGKDTKKSGDEAGKAAPKVEDLAKAQKGTAQSAEALAKQLDETTDEIKQQGEAALGAIDANIQWEQSLDDAKTALKENGKTLDLNTQKGRDNMSALNDLAEAAWAGAEAVKANGGSEDDYRRKLVASRAALERTARQFGMTKEEAKKYAASVLAIPAAKNTKINLDAAHAKGELAYLRGQIRAMDGSVIHVRAQAVLNDSAVRGIATGGVAGSQPGRAASGGIRSNMTWVGEHGPELLSLPPGSRVYSNPDSQRMAAQSGGGGGAHVILEFRSDDAAELARIRRLVRATGGVGTDSVQVAFGGGR